MIHLIKSGKILLLSLICVLISGKLYAESVTKEKVTITYEILEDGSYKIIDVMNGSPSKIILHIGKYVTTIKAGGSAKIKKVSRGPVKFDYPRSSGHTLLAYKEAPVQEKEILQPNPADSIKQETDTTEKTEATATVSSSKSNKKEKTNKKDEAQSVASSKPITTDGYSIALNLLNKDDFFGNEAVDAYTQKVDSYVYALSQSNDQRQFLVDNEINQFLKNSEHELESKKAEIPTIASNIIRAAKINNSSSRSAFLNSIIEQLTNRLNIRKTSFLALQDAVNKIDDEHPNEISKKESIINYAIISVIVLILFIWLGCVVMKKRNKTKPSHSSIATKQPQDESNVNNQAIVVRRRTTTILKKQDIDDVKVNSDYLIIKSSEYTQDSAVRNIYLKNTCIKEIYNLYAEDLRDTNKPKEDGCMVLGRWIYDEDSNTYDVSLETVVFPGDDAIFKEYELNFGGKIKLRVAEKLRKLRKETNLQYDLVCWIHSHPGLGVFFSNSDVNVQMQLKHAQHPNFLVAFVIDILTSDQQMGIFTFRKDGSINSKGDLTKLYSLEELYKWALKSENVSFNPDNYYNVIESAKTKLPACNGIELNNSAIIDLTQIIIDSKTDIIGWIIGVEADIKGNKEFIVSKIVQSEVKPTTGVIGVLIGVTHMSVPTIQRLINTENINPSFILVYSSKQNTLTSIPVINGELITDEHFYGEETIENLKIWTRRKR